MVQNSGSSYDGAMVGIKPSVTTHLEPFDKSRKLGRGKQLWKSDGFYLCPKHHFFFKFYFIFKLYNVVLALHHFLKKFKEMPYNILLLSWNFYNLNLSVICVYV